MRDIKTIKEIEQEMIETKEQINKVKQMKSRNSIAWLQGFLSGLNWVLTGSKE